MKLHANIIGTGKPFIILHGFIGMGDNWKTLGKQFSEWGYSIHLIDQRNHGRSSHSPDFSYQLMANDLKEYCEDNALENIVLLGHSMGGKTAMEFATSFPELVQKLIIADIAPKYYAPHHQDILDGLQSLDFSEIKTRGEADKALASYVPEPGIRMFLLKNLYWKEKGILGLRLNIQVLAEKAHEIGTPLAANASYQGHTLFLRGAKSNYILDEDIPHIKTHFSNMLIATVPNAGHWLHAENPSFFAGKIAEFLQ